MLLVSFKEDTEILLPIPQEVKDDLHIWATAINTAAKGMPIPRRPSPHLPSALCFASDASGAQVNNIRADSSQSLIVGTGEQCP
jgi:hypothetical protein